MLSSPGPGDDVVARGGGGRVVQDIILAVTSFLRVKHSAVRTSISGHGPRPTDGNKCGNSM